MDGVTVGHPRCNVNLCTQRLASPRDRFCPEHQSQNNVCAIHDCELPCATGRRTCSTPAHREFEDQKREDGRQAIFQLKKRLLNRSFNSAVRGLSAEGAGQSSDIGEPAVNDTDLFDELVLPSDSISNQPAHF